MPIVLRLNLKKIYQMSNYYATARSNYFGIKDKEAFKEALKEIPIQIEFKNAPYQNIAAIFATCETDGAWPSNYENSEGEDAEINWNELIHPHLQDNHICILQEVGAEKLCYLTGWAIAFNNKGEEIYLSLYDIVDLAEQKFGKSAIITGPEY